MTGNEKENIKKEKKNQSRGGASDAEVVCQKLEMNKERFAETGRS